MYFCTWLPAGFLHSALSLSLNHAMREMFFLCFSIYSHLAVIYFPVALPFIFTPAGRLHFTSVAKLVLLIQHFRTNFPHS